MSEKQTINDLLMEVAKLRKDNDYLSGELGYWKQQASVTDGCDTESGVTLRDLFGIWKDTSDQLEADSREKLEEYCEKLIENIQRRIFSGRDAGALRCQLKELLDRQAAITESSICENCALQYGANVDMESRLNELQEKVAELEADATRVEFDVPHYGWHEGDGRDTASWKANYMHMKDRVHDLQEQVDELKDKYAKLLSEQAIAATLGSDQELIDLAHNAWSMALCAMQGMPIPAEWGDRVERGLRKHGINVDEELAGFEVIDDER